MNIQTPETPREQDREVLRSVTASTTVSPAWREDSLVRDDPNYFPPNKQDIVLTDITAKFLHSDLSELLGVPYLSNAVDAQDNYNVRGAAAKVNRGRIVGNNSRYMINLECRRDSLHSRPGSPKMGSKDWKNVFFLVDTGSPNSFMCAEAMEALIGSKALTFPPRLQWD